jgi:hypothetical protein
MKAPRDLIAKRVAPGVVPNAAVSAENARRRPGAITEEEMTHVLAVIERWLRSQLD